MSTASRGAAREHRLKRQLEADGWVIVRAAGSKGVDLWAMRSVIPAIRAEFDDRLTETLAIQVKANTGSPWMNFRSSERADLGLIAAKAGAEAWLVHWPPHGECCWYAEREWPRAKVAA